jgi:hypothetical protein
MLTTSAVRRGRWNAANRSTGPTLPLFATPACPRRTAEAPAGPARRARRASPRSTPTLDRLTVLSCLAATVALTKQVRRPRSGLRAALSPSGDRYAEGRARVAVQWLLTLIEGRRSIGACALPRAVPISIVWCSSKPVLIFGAPRAPRRPWPLPCGTFRPPHRPAPLAAGGTTLQTKRHVWLRPVPSRYLPCMAAP